MALFISGQNTFDRSLERYLICIFVFREWVGSYDILGNINLKGLAKDASAKHHFEYLLTKFEENTNCYKNGYAWNVHNNRYEKLNGDVVHYNQD